jgi:hypothetical protein
MWSCRRLIRTTNRSGWHRTGRWSAPTRPPAAWSIATTAAGPNVPDGIQKTQAPEKLVFADPAVEEHLRRWGASQRRAGLANSRSCQLLDRRPAGRLASCPPSSGWPWPRCWDNLRRPDLPAGPVAPERLAQRAGGRSRCRSRTPSPGIAGDRLVPGGIVGDHFARGPGHDALRSDLTDEGGTYRSSLSATADRVSAMISGRVTSVFSTES